ncbi:MAG: succinate dehydrogenase/fumarate reductase cytochrome b subunit [Syntrophobacteraceae bacterium]|nr:succinate dehydrogenase/fumarate reductase cytochrome b subunit [Syntrophobacteraceae bacterium]
MSNQAIAMKEPVRTEGCLDFFQMLSGVGLIVFMWSHLILVASVNLGARAMDALAYFLEKYYLAQIGGPLVFALFLFHFVLAARKLPFRATEQKEMWEHCKRFNHTETWLWMVQAGTAMIILIMGSIHMWTVLTTMPIQAAKSAQRIQGGWWLLFFLVLLPMIELHTSIGFYRIGVKWGFITRADRKFWKRIENRLTLAFIAIGLVTLINFYFIQKAM